jgi:hypothetical protein
MVDVGCGIGGSSRYIARKFNCESRGITLSPIQAQRANVLSQQQGFGERLSFQVAGGYCMCCTACTSTAFIVLHVLQLPISSKPGLSGLHPVGPPPVAAPASAASTFSLHVRASN